MLTVDNEEDSYLGQFIPLQYHYAMLSDANRMRNFKAAIEHVVTPGSKVLELGGGTGVLSWFAAAKAEKVWCVEYNPELVTAARQLLAINQHGHKVEVIQANAFDFLPPEPVDVLICEMIHVAMLREKLVEVMASFKQRYQQRFGNTLPILMPTAVIMAVQPLQLDYEFEGYYAPIVQVQELSGDSGKELAAPTVYSTLDFTRPTDGDFTWSGDIPITQDGTVTALRFITKNILAILPQQQTSIDWLNRYMAFPLTSPVKVQSGDLLHVSFAYRAGGSIKSLQNSLRAHVRQI